MKGYCVEGMGKESSRAANGAARWRSRPRRRAVDRAAVGNVKLWNCGNMKVWKYGNGLLVLPVAGGNDACGEYARQLSFHRLTSFPCFHISTVSYFHNFTFVSVKPFVGGAFQHPIEQVESVYIYVDFHDVRENAKAGLPRPCAASAVPWRVDDGIVPNLSAVRKGANFVTNDFEDENERNAA